ncbi:MAG: apolipoprotein N-acyltransferase [Thermodesulfobacteriota bacterium]
MKKNFNFIFYSSISVLLFTISFAGYGYSFLIWFALVPFLMAVSAYETKRFKKGIAFGAVLHTASLIWLAQTISSYGGLPYLSSVAAIVLLGLYLGIYTGIFALLLPDTEKKPVISLFLIPAVWTGLDFTVSFLFSGFPWVFAGYTQYKNLDLIQLGSVTGIYGITYYIILINTALFLLINSFLKTKKILTKQNLYIAVAIFIVSGVIFTYGNFSIKKTQNLIKKAEHSSILILQPNILPESKNSGSIKKTLKEHTSLSKKFSGEYDFALWPETSLPYPVFSDKNLLNKIKNHAQTNGNQIIGLLSVKKDHKNNYTLKNRSVLFTKNGNFDHFYDKIHLVPFGEYIPLKKYFPFFEKFIVPSGEFNPGKENNFIKHNKLKAGIKICFEIIFPDLVRKQVKQGSNIIINMTNDAWFGKTPGPYQHLAISVLRAAENKRSVARAANTGISAHILPTGEIKEKTSIFEKKSVLNSLPLLEEKTFYTKYGDFFAYICFAVLLLQGFFFYRKLKKQ